MKPTLLYISLMISALMLSACGQKGALYLPLEQSDQHENRSILP